MLSKEDVLKNFLREDTEDVIKVYQAMSLAYNKGIPSFTKFFCKPNIWMYFIKNFSNNNFLVEAKGAFEECDRRILSFNNIYSIPFPYKIIKINNKSKFNNLSHKDYLGAIMALGIEREKLGDLRVIDNSAIVPVYDEVANYILYELKNVGKAPVSIEEITEDNLPISNFLQGVIIEPSLRLDNIDSNLANI